MNRGYYAIIPANVRYDKSLPANAKLLYGEITALCNEKGYCWATNNYFAELYGVSTRSITTWISILINKGYIFSEITYKEGTKEIDMRKLIIASADFHRGIEENFHRGIEENFHRGIEENFHRGIEENFQENNTDINNTIINKKEKYKKEKVSKKQEVENLPLENLPIENMAVNKVLNNKVLNNKEKDNSKELSKKKVEKVVSKKVFKKPTADEVIDYCLSANINIDADRFIDFYESKGWRVGSAPMKDWKAAARNWSRRENNTPARTIPSQNKTITPGSLSSFTLEDLESKANKRYKIQAQEMMDRYERDLGLKT